MLGAHAQIFRTKLVVAKSKLINIQVIEPSANDNLCNPP